MLATRDVSLLFRAGASHVVAVTFFVTDGTLAVEYATLANSVFTQCFFESTCREQARLYVVLQRRIRANTRDISSSTW